MYCFQKANTLSEQYKSEFFFHLTKNLEQKLALYTNKFTCMKYIKRYTTKPN